MTVPRTLEASLARARHPDEETRYQAALELDGAEPAALAVLLSLLSDQSWRVRAAALERLAAAPDREAQLPALLALLDGGGSPGARDAAATALVQVGGAALPHLVERLGAPAAALRLAALGVLSQLADRRAAPALAACLADPDPNVRAAAAEALGQVGGAEAAGALLAALDSDDPTLRLAALEGLAAGRVAPPAYRLSRLMGDRALRPAAYRTLGASDEPAALELLADGPSERSRTAREAALGAIGQLRSRRGAEALARLAQVVRAAGAQDPSVAEGCVAALASEEPFVTLGALTVLAWVGEARHAPAMARLADDDRYRPLVEEGLEALPRGTELLGYLSQVLPELSPLARTTVHGALASAGNAASLQALVYGAGDADPQVQAESIAALGRLGDARAVGPLAGLLDDGQAAVAGLAASALARIAGRSAEGRRAVLMECRARAAASPSAAIFRILGAVGEGEDLRLVRGGLGSGEVLRRMAAAAAVASLGRRGYLKGEHLPELIAALGDPAWSVRAAAARAFVELAEANAERRRGDPDAGEHPLCAEAMRALGGALADAEPAVRAAAVEALGACGREEHAARVAAVAAAAGEPPLVMVAALHALARLGRPPVAVLEAALGHDDAEVAKEAVAATAALDRPDRARLLLLAAASARWDVRHAAARAMGDAADPALRAAAARLAEAEPDLLVAKAFADAARAAGGSPGGR